MMCLFKRSHLFCRRTGTVGVSGKNLKRVWLVAIVTILSETPNFFSLQQCNRTQLNFFYHFLTFWSLLAYWATLESFMIIDMKLWSLNLSEKIHQTLEQYQMSQRCRLVKSLVGIKEEFPSYHIRVVRTFRGIQNSETGKQNWRKLSMECLKTVWSPLHNGDLNDVFPLLVLFC